MKMFMEKYHQDLEKIMLHFPRTLIVLVFDLVVIFISTYVTIHMYVIYSITPL